MLWELWHYLTTPVSKPAKKMGYLYESIALAQRAKRCQSSWHSHYQACQNAMLTSCENLPSYRTALIFGAGTLADIPLAALSARFERVILVDLVFLKAALQTAKAFPNVECRQMDVTESIEWIFDGILKPRAPTAFLNDATLDWVASLNVITQLPLLPVRWLLTHYALNETQADELGLALIRQHLSYLASFQAPVCLIADRRCSEFDRQGKQIDEWAPWWGMSQPNCDLSWDWEVIPYHESAKGQKRQVNRVGVTLLNPADAKESALFFQD